MPTRMTPSGWSTAQAMWRDGNTQGALIALKTAVRAQPEAEDARRILVGFYREIRHLDQAGRWAIAVDGWATALEKERLARLIAQSTAARGDLRKFLALPADPDENAELRELMAGPVEEHIRQYAATPAARESSTSWGEGLFDVTIFGWLATLIVYLLGLNAVYISTAFGIGDPQGFARFVGWVSASLAGLVLLVATVAAVAERRWIMATALAAGALVITGASLAALIGLLTV